MSQVYQSALESVRQIMQAQAVNANNLANASTDGFKAELAYVTGIDSVLVASSVPDMTSGPVKTTGRDLDVAINGEGWFAVLGNDGTEGYTRRGDFQVDAFGQLKDGVGRPVMGNSGPIALPPFSSIEIAVDGTVSIQPLGQTANTLAVIDRIRLVSLDLTTVSRSDDGLMRLAGGELAVADANVRVISGALEGSNVNAVGEMVKMIDLARRYEAQINTLRSEEENGDSLLKIMSMS